MFHRLVAFLALHPPLSHVVLALLMQAMAGAVLTLLGVRRAWWFGAVLAIGFYFGRKKLEVELHADPSGLHKAATWALGWVPFQWPPAYQLQFYAPAAAVLLAATLAEALARRARTSGR